MELIPDLSRIEREEEKGIEVAPEATSLDFLQSVYRDAQQPLGMRMRAASIAIAYEHPKLAVAVSITGGFGSQMEALMEKRGLRSVIDARALPKPSPSPPEE